MLLNFLHYFKWVSFIVFLLIFNIFTTHISISITKDFIEILPEYLKDRTLLGKEYTKENYSIHPRYFILMLLGPLILIASVSLILTLL